VEEDVLNAFTWYESRAGGLGEDFLRAFYAAVHALPRQPHLYPEVHEKFRRCLLSRFPYATYYQLYEAEVVVFGVFHCARDPKAIGRVLGSRE
jgi:plasmid stabilization system protein ParE